MDYKIIVVLVLLLQSCEGDGRLILKNNSVDTLYFQWSPNNYLDYTNVLNISDTVSLRYPSDSINKYYELFPNRLLPYSNNHLFNMSNWKGTILNSDSQKIWIFIFDQSTLNNFKWDTIAKYQKYKARLEFTKEDIDNGNWIINYPK